MPLFSLCGGVQHRRVWNRSSMLERARVPVCSLASNAVPPSRPDKLLATIYDVYDHRVREEADHLAELLSWTVGMSLQARGQVAHDRKWYASIWAVETALVHWLLVLSIEASVFAPSLAARVLAEAHVFRWQSALADNLVSFRVLVSAPDRAAACTVIAVILYRKVGYQPWKPRASSGLPCSRRFCAFQ